MHSLQMPASRLLLEIAMNDSFTSEIQFHFTVHAAGMTAELLLRTIYASYMRPMTTSCVTCTSMLQPSV